MMKRVSDKEVSDAEDYYKRVSAVVDYKRVSDVVDYDYYYHCHCYY